MGDSQYSFSLTTFSPSEKLVQIEYALMVVGSGQTSLGIKVSSSIQASTMVLPHFEHLECREVANMQFPCSCSLYRGNESQIRWNKTRVQKIQLLTTTIEVVYSGMGSDFRVLVRKSRKQAQQYYRLYKVCFLLSCTALLCLFLYHKKEAHKLGVRLSAHLHKGELQNKKRQKSKTH
ncbi:hypothetical protein Taro_013872 [Colocasia esculenta]|uniref:Proteasome alpha-type subunits domain-containing protein n=1 Tax=Colocasia esculenta TaxID=4460 RepID=A0A843UCV7_COLES|nr:hypothetical protein [Colocasia esculenta]